MPSKRTNDSVDRILQDLNMQQAEAGLRDSVTDRQVDEILRSVGISTTDAPPMPQNGFAFGGADGLDELLNAPANKAAAPVQPAPQPRRTAPAPQPAQSRPAPAQPVQQSRPAPTQPPKEGPAGDTTPTFSGDTTGTGIIKGFLVNMSADGRNVDTESLNRNKNQFQRFFRESAAVVPDERGRMPKPEKTKRGPFGMKYAEDTGEFVPINVSLSARQDKPEPEEYYPDEELEAPAPRQPAKKRGFLDKLLGRDEETEELMIPEARAEEPAPLRAAPAPQPAPSAPAAPAEDTQTQEVWRSKYTRPARSSYYEEIGDKTQQLIRGTVDYAQQNPAAPAASGMTGTIFRKKKNTVEFTPGQKIQTTPPPQPMPQHSGEPVGEPIETPRTQTAPPPASTGFTMQMDAVSTAPVDSTQEFMNAYNAVRRPRKETPRPAVQPAPVQPVQTAQPAGPAAQEPQEDPYADTIVLGTSSKEEAEQTRERLMPRRERDDVDTLVDTLTGRIQLTPTAPAQPAAPAHTGFTQSLDAAPAQPAHTGFTQNLGAVPPAEDAHSGYTQQLGSAAPAEPNTSAFVNNIANTINTPQPKEDTSDYDNAAARLTASLAEDASATRTHAHIPTAADMRKAAARFTGRAADESEDNAASPFDTAEIPVPRTHEYERAEDAPAVRSALAKQLTVATVAAIVSGAVAAVLIIIGALPIRPAALADSTVYPAVVLVLLLAACAANWQAFVSGFKGLVKGPTPDSLSVLPALGAAVQCIAMLATGGYPGELPMLAGPAALVLCLNAVGRRLNAAAASDNFTLVSAKVDHAVAYRLKDAGALRAVSQGLAETHPSVLVSRPTQIFRSFLTKSAARGTSDKNQQQFAWILGGCGLAAFLFTVIRTKDPATAATAMAGVFCLAAPLAGTLLSALPARMMQRSAAQVGAVVPGWSDIRQLGRINVIQVTSRDLFPAGCVTLAGIKPVKPEHIDTAIVYAASILSEAGPTLKNVFMNMLGENRSLLAKVDDRETIYGKGYMGWINKRRVLVGNRALMQDFGIKIPSLEYEQHHTVNQRRVIYLAVSGKLFAMFQVAYQRDPDTAAVLETLNRAGLSLVVDCDDFNCDVALLETAYSLPAGSVKVLNSAEHQAMAPAVAWLPESEGNMLHLGSFASFVGGLEAAAGAAEGERKSAIVLTVSVLLSCAVGVLLTLTGGLVTLPLVGIVLYQAAWCVLALIFPLLQRY